MSRVWSNSIIGRWAECAALVSDRAAKRQSLQCPKGKRAQAEKLEHEHARGCLARRHTRAPSPARGEIPKRRSVASVRRCSTARARLARVTRKTPHMCISALLWGVRRAPVRVREQWCVLGSGPFESLDRALQNRPFLETEWTPTADAGFRASATATTNSPFFAFSRYTSLSKIGSGARIPLFPLQPGP